MYNTIFKVWLLLYIKDIYNGIMLLAIVTTNVNKTNHTCTSDYDHSQAFDYQL